MKLTNETEISKEVKRLRMHLTPVLSDHYKYILIEVERRLTTGKASTIANPITKKKITNKRPTKKDFYAMLFNK